MCCDVLRGMTVELVLEIGVLSVEYTTGPVVGRLLYHLYIYGLIGRLKCPTSEHVATTYDTEKKSWEGKPF